MKQLRSKPVCGECGSPVESFTEEDGTGALAGRVIFVAKCHGATERVTVPRSATKGLNFGVAFAPEVPRLNAVDTKALPPAPGAGRK